MGPNKKNITSGMLIYKILLSNGTITHKNSGRVNLPFFNGWHDLMFTNRIVSCYNYTSEKDKKVWK